MLWDKDQAQKRRSRFSISWKMLKDKTPKKNPIAIMFYSRPWLRDDLISSVNNINATFLFYTSFIDLNPSTPFELFFVFPWYYCELNSFSFHFQALCRIGQFLADNTGLSFSKDRLQYKPVERPRVAQEPWRALYL